MNHGLWIPERIWALPLSLHERIFLAVIQSYADTGKDCFASNEFLAQRCDTSEVQIRKTIKKLLDLGYLSRDGYASSRKWIANEGERPFLILLMWKTEISFSSSM